MFQGSFNGVEEVLRKFQGRFREVTWMFHESYKLGCFEAVFRVFQGSFKGVL